MKRFHYQNTLYPQRTLDNTKRIFNYRLSRGRKSVECAFGMMTKKFQVLSSPIRTRTTERVVNIIKSVCILHNFIRISEGVQYHIDEPQTTFLERSTSLVPTRTTLHSESSASDIRNYLANYFLTPGASLPWQWEFCI